MANPLTRRLLKLCLRAVPGGWRNDVQRDLLEEQEHSAAWRCRQAIAIGARMRWAARRDGGDRTPVSTLSMLAQDGRFAWRTLRTQPAWTAVAVITLALGIGANAAVFSVVRSTLLNPLPFPAADRLVIPWLHDSKLGIATSPSRSAIAEWRTHARSIEAVELYRLQDMTLTGQGDPAVVHTANISDTFDEFAGAPFLVGRGFTASETAIGARPVAVLGERAWRHRFNGDRTIVGRSIVLDGVAREVIGVISDALRFPSQFQAQARRDVLLPFINDPAELGGSTIARLAPNVTVETASQELDSLLPGMAEADRLPGTFKTWLSRPGAAVEYRRSLVMLAWAVAIVLLIACVNVAHLLLARGLMRERELAIRTALGAGRARLMRQLITESVALAAVGGVTGLLAGSWLLRGLTAMRPARLEILDFASLDATVVVAAAATTLTAGLGFGLISAWRAGRSAIADTLRATSTGVTHDKSRQRLRSLLIVGEVAMAAVLLVGATLLVRSVLNLQHVDVGFDTRDLYTLRVPLPPERCQGQAAKTSAEFCRQYAQDWLDRARAVPGIIDATLAASAPPQDARFMLGQWSTRELPAKEDAPQTMTAVNNVRPNYFSVLGLAIKDGRSLTADSDALHEVVINERFARALWPGDRAVGRQLRAGRHETDPWLTVVGVVADSSIQDIRQDPSERVVYFGSPTNAYSLIVRTQAGFDPSQPLRAISLATNANLAVPSVTNVAAAFDAASIAASRFTMTLLMIFALVAVLLCAVGLYGVISYLVSQRTREIGIRLALGSSRSRIARLVLMRALVLTISGLAIGLTASRWAASLVASLLYGVEAFDPIAYATGAALLLGVAALACVAPMSRAMRVDPLTAAREP